MRRVSPAGRTALLHEALAPLTVDGARSALGDAAKPVLLPQGEVEILIAFGSDAATDGWGG